MEVWRRNGATDSQEWLGEKRSMRGTPPSLLRPRSALQPSPLTRLKKRISCNDGAAAPVEGKEVLRFLEAEREPTVPVYGAGACHVFQLVDLHSLKSDAATDDSTLELSV